MSARDFLSSIPVFGSLFDNSDEKALQEIAEGKELWGGLETPDLQWQDYSPESAQYSLNQEDPATLLAQSRAIEQSKLLADQGLSAQDKLGFAQAELMGNQMANSSRQAALQNAAARGVGGSGLEFAMGEMGRQSASDQARMSALQQAAASAQGRAANQANYTQALGNQRDQNYRTQSDNTGIINNFNAMNTQARNNAQQYNNEGRLNTQQQNFGNDVTKMNGLTGANQQMANAYGAQNAARTSARNANTQAVTDLASGLIKGGI